VISAADNCYKCHNELFFHGGGRRSFVTCLVCHGDSGGEDRAQRTSLNALPTTGLTIAFRTMLHKIHLGEELTNAATYVVIGNAGSRNMYDEVVFPAWPGGVRECSKCHGNTAWHEPQGRTHPLGQTFPTRVWRAVCGACHDGATAQAHIDSNTSPSGAEGCAVCHGAGREWEVPKVHFVR